MSFWTSTLNLLADAAAEKPAAPAPGAQGGGDMFSLLAPMLIIGVLWYFLLIHPQRKEQRQRSDRLKSLKKNDKVVTIGGIIGTIVNIEPDGNEVTLQVSDNTRIKFLRTSIQTVLSEDKKSEEDDASKNAKS
ncbi:MAG: preprotein translocase subunit YajC [Planctomycetaceae bacterium]